jgi:hypothetical protein
VRQRRLHLRFINCSFCSLCVQTRTAGSRPLSSGDIHSIHVSVCWWAIRLEVGLQLLRCSARQIIIGAVCAYRHESCAIVMIVYEIDQWLVVRVTCATTEASAIRGSTEPGIAGAPD